jgi:hypothetical protein
VDNTLAVAAIGLLGAALGALATYWVQLRADIRTGRAQQTIIQLDLDRAFAAAKVRVRTVWGEAEAKEISQDPAAELARLDDVHFPDPGLAAQIPTEQWAPLPALASWDADRAALAARVDQATVELIHRAALAIGAFNDAAARYRDRKSGDAPLRAVRRALATTARAQAAAKQTARAQRVIDKFPGVVTVLLAVAAIAGIVALTGVFQAAKPSATRVASALSAALGPDEVVECEPNADHYRCVAFSEECQTAAVVPTTCPQGTGRSVDRYEAYLGEAASAGGVALTALSRGAPPTPAADSCPTADVLTAVDDADLTELEHMTVAKRPRSLRLVNAIVTCIVKLAGKRAATPASTAAASLPPGLALNKRGGDTVRPIVSGARAT